MIERARHKKASLTGRTRSGLTLVPVRSAKYLKGGAQSRWDIVLECGHELKNHLRAHAAPDEPPRWAGCRECTEAQR